ncbi:hypothetical protein BKA65DRAFT_406953, partial [Rhexocercosporidium sp. MPI-PUGE-AT-0058]
YSDLLLRCKGKQLELHRAIGCLQSKPLAGAIDGQCKVFITRENVQYERTDHTGTGSSYGQGRP